MKLNDDEDDNDEDEKEDDKVISTGYLPHLEDTHNSTYSGPRKTRHRYNNLSTSASTREIDPPSLISTQVQ